MTAASGENNWWNSANQAISNIKLYQYLVESLAPLHQIMENKEKLTDLTGFPFDHLSVPFMGSLFCKVRIFKESIWGEMGSWTLRKMLFHMTVLDLVPAESWSSFEFPSIYRHSFCP